MQQSIVEINYIYGTIDIKKISTYIVAYIIVTLQAKASIIETRISLINKTF